MEKKAIAELFKAGNAVRWRGARMRGAGNHSPREGSGDSR
jgi:hypothetical protein